MAQVSEFSGQLHAPKQGEGDWVDETSSESPPASSPPSSPPRPSTPSRTAQLRKRRVPPIANVSPRKTTQIKRPKKAQPAQSVTTPEARPNIIDYRVVNTLAEGALYSLHYMNDVFRSAISLLKWPLSFLLFLWMLAMIFAPIHQILRTSFAPLCYVPGMSSLRLCASEPLQHPGDKTPLWADYPSLVKVQSATFEQLLGESVSGSQLALEIKNAQLAARDLVPLLRTSNLKRRDALGDILAEFLQDASKAGRGLQRFNAKLNGAVDQILSINNYALHEIEAASSQTTSLISWVFWPFSSGRPTANEITTERFTDSMNILASAFTRLIMEAEINIANLDELEVKLNVFYETMVEEDRSLKSAKSELLATLWTQLGGNKHQIRDMDDHLSLLKNLGHYRNQALAHVVIALETLNGVSAEMEELRDRVAAPELMGSKIPVHVHIKTIQEGLERLKEEKLKAKGRREKLYDKVILDGDDSDS